MPLIYTFNKIWLAIDHLYTRVHSSATKSKSRKCPFSLNDNSINIFPLISMFQFNISFDSFQKTTIGHLKTKVKKNKINIKSIPFPHISGNKLVLACSAKEPYSPFNNCWCCPQINCGYTFVIKKIETCISCSVK